MYKELSLEYYRTENGYLVEYTSSGTTPTTRHYGFAEWEDTVKKLIEILSETIGKKLIKSDDAEAIVLSLNQTKAETIDELAGRMVDILRKIREL